MEVHVVERIFDFVDDLEVPQPARALGPILSYYKDPSRGPRMAQGFQLWGGA